MKLASYVVDGAEAYGVVKGDGVITMNRRFGGHAASLREALAGDLLPQIKEAAANASPDRKLSVLSPSTTSAAAQVAIRDPQAIEASLTIPLEAPRTARQPPQKQLSW